MCVAQKVILILPGEGGSGGRGEGSGGVKGGVYGERKEGGGEGLERIVGGRGWVGERGRKLVGGEDG